MASRYDVAIDSQYLRREVARLLGLSGPGAVRPQGGGVRGFAEGLAGQVSLLAGMEVRQVRWYEAQWPGFLAADPRIGRQRDEKESFIGGFERSGGGQVKVRRGVLLPEPLSWTGVLDQAVAAFARETGQPEADLKARLGVHIAAAHKRRPNVKEKGVDVQLAVDALRRSTRPTVSAFVLVSGDADYVPLVNGLRADGVPTALVCGINKTTADDLRDAVREVLRLDVAHARQITLT